ncbi:MAG: fibronectin type III domain-containing protein, partial [Ilumatobacteraceae bacterium]
MIFSSTNTARRARKTTMAALAMCMIIPAFEAVSPSTVSAAPPGPEVVYDAIGPSVAPSVQSLAFESQATSEFGDLIELAPGSRVLQDITVELVSWACEVNTYQSNFCGTTPGKTFTHPLTIKGYSVAGVPGSPTVGAELFSVTQNSQISFRPSADNVHCTGADIGKWYDGSVCRNGYAFPVTFPDAVLPDIVLPGQFIWTISYNTTNFGADPIGATCVPTTNCGYDALNVGFETTSANAFTGYDLNSDTLFWKTTNSYCDGDVLNVLRERCGWTGYRPMARITAKQTSYTPVTTVVDTAHPNQWTAIRENPTDLVYPNVTFAAGPGTPPLGNGSAQLTTAGITEGQSLLTPQFNLTKLADITTISYSMQTTGAVPALSFDIKYRPTDTQYSGRLVYEPTYSGITPTTGWNTFNPLAGKWWASKQDSFAANNNCGTGGVAGQPCTWSEVLAKWPDAQLANPSGSVGNLVIKLGSGAPATTANIDSVVFGVTNSTGDITVTTFDFDPAAPGAPTNVLATPFDGSATLTWNPPADTGGLPVTYTITGATCTIASSGVAATCDSLTNGTTYNLSITTDNAVGSSAAVVVPVTPTAASVSSVAYDSIGPNPAPSYISLGFQATSAQEFGDLVELSPGPRNLDEITVQMVAWGCQSGSGLSCVTDPANGPTSFSHPMTVKVYAVAGTPSNPTVGDELASVTQTVSVPFRPSASAACGDGRWQAADLVCRNGFGFTVDFDFIGTDTVLPEQVIWTIQYNTTNRGYNPVGGPCTNNCAYDSLNVGADSRGNAGAFVGVDIDPDAIFWNSSFDFYCDSMSVLNTLREDCDWTGNRPMATIVTTAVSTTQVAKTVKTAATEGWTWWTDGAATT